MRHCRDRKGKPLSACRRLFKKQYYDASEAEKNGQYLEAA
jgi:hypothetical protein